MENFSSGVMKKYGLDYASVAPSNPRLVYCSISAYGRQGPFASRPGFDPITQAESGFMSLNGFPDGPPVRTGPPAVDLLTGMSACNAILLALFARDRLGRGQHVEVALFDMAVAMTQFYGMAYLMTGVNPSRQGNSPNGSPSVGVYEASDAPFYIACANDRLYRRLVIEVLGRPDLASGEFGDRRSRTANKERLRAILTGVFVQDLRENWVTKMKAANIPVGFLRTVEEAFNSPEVRERHRVSQIPHPAAGSVPNIESPINLGLTPVIDPVAAPLLGEHTKEVLRKTLGYDDARIAALAEAGVFRHGADNGCRVNRAQGWAVGSTTIFGRLLPRPVAYGRRAFFRFWTPFSLGASAAAADRAHSCSVPRYHAGSRSRQIPRSSTQKWPAPERNASLSLRPR